jgi:hypothetical protein
MYSRIKSTKSTASGADDVSDPEANVTNQEGKRSHVLIDQCVTAARAVKVAIFACLHSSCNNVTEVGGP